MRKREMEVAIEIMIENVNDYSREVEKAKEKNLSLTGQYYFHEILNIEKAMFHLGYNLEEDGNRADCEEGEEPIEYMHYKASKRRGEA